MNWWWFVPQIAGMAALVYLYGEWRYREGVEDMRRQVIEGALDRMQDIFDRHDARKKP